jgi:hypothetical protein
VLTVSKREVSVDIGEASAHPNRVAGPHHAGLVPE